MAKDKPKFSFKFTKKQYIQFGVSLGISLVVIGLFSFLYMLLFGNAKLAEKKVQQGDNYYISQQYELAESSYRAALQNDKYNELAILGLSKTLIVQDKTDDAVSILQFAIKNKPGTFAFYQLMIETYVKANRISDAYDFISNIKHTPILMRLKDIRPANVTFTPSPGSYNNFVEVTMTGGEDCTIYYTTDGSEPNLDSQVYTEPFKLEQNQITLKVFSVNSQYYISDIQTAIYNIYNDSAPFTFTDAKVEAIVRAQLGITSETVMYSDVNRITHLTNTDSEGNPIDGYIRVLDDLVNMPSLTEVTLSNEPVLTGLSNFASISSLSSLTLTNCNIDNTSLAEITTATNLKRLSLSDNKISDIASLASLENLQHLNIANNMVSDISTLSILFTLETLDLSGNSITDLSPIAELIGIYSLDISKNGITSLEAIFPLAHLSVLKANSNNITNISGLAIFGELSELNLSQNPIQSINPVAGLTNLKILDLSRIEISDLAPLTNLEKLQTLKLENCGISDISALSSLSNLTTLNLKNASAQTSEVTPYLNNIVDIGPLSSLSSLQTLIIEYNSGISQLRPLRDCSSLRSIYCSGCGKIDTTALKGTSITVYND